MLQILSFMSFLACSDKEKQPTTAPLPQEKKERSEKPIKRDETVSSQKISIPEKETSAAPPQKQIFKNADFQIEYNAGSILAKDSKGGLLSTLYTPQKPDEGCESEENAVVLSLVQGFASIQVNGWGYCEGAAHPYAFTSWATVYVVKPFKEGETENFWNYNKVSITTFFPEEQVLEGLLQDSVIQRYLPKNAVPKTIAALSELLDGGCEISFSDLEYNFAFHHIKDDKVAVRFGLPYGCEANRGNFTQLGVYLPVPEKWKTAFQATPQNKTLMKDISL